MRWFDRFLFTPEFHGVILLVFLMIFFVIHSKNEKYFSANDSTYYHAVGTAFLFTFIIEVFLWCIWIILYA
jgi:hypothetical protein